MNILIISGNITRDPEGKQTPNGNFVCKLSVAMNEKYKDKSGQMQESVTFIEVEIWGKCGEMINTRYRKGDSITLHGKLKQDNWEDRETGAKRSKLKMVAHQKDSNWPNHKEPVQNASVDKPAAQTSQAPPTTTTQPSLEELAKNIANDDIDNIPF